MNSLREYMNEEKLVNRWIVLIIGLVGVFIGAILMYMIALLGLVT